MKGDGDYSVATPVAYSEAPAGIAGLALCWLAFHLATTASGLGVMIIIGAIAILGVVAVLLGIRSIIIRLHFNQDRLAIVTGPFERSVHLRELVEVGYRRSGRAGFYVLRDGRGGRLNVPVTRFKRDDQWKKLILDSATATGAEIDPKARRSLREADGTGHGYLL
jgi:hypothetical protein